jgi:hypothetical protein
MRLITACFYLNHPSRFRLSLILLKAFIALSVRFIVISNNTHDNINSILTSIFNKRSNLNTGKATELTLRKLIINLWRIII